MNRQKPRTTLPVALYFIRGVGYADANFPCTVYSPIMVSVTAIAINQDTRTCC